MKKNKETSLKEEYLIINGEQNINFVEPLNTNNEKIVFLKHDMYGKLGEQDKIEAINIKVAVKNISDQIIGSALFETTLFDVEGKFLDKIYHKEFELHPNNVRIFLIDYPGSEFDKIKNYQIKIDKISVTPTPTAIGNNKIQIIKHFSRLEREKSRKRGDDREKAIEAKGVDLAIRNISDSNIATVIFEVSFYDIEGNILEVVKHKEIDIQANASRAIVILATTDEFNKIESYNVRIIRTTMADREKVQLRRHFIKTNELKEEELSGVLINISNEKADAAVVANFYNWKEENIGIKVLMYKDIEPRAIKKYLIKFKPQEGDIVSSYSVNIGEIETEQP